METVRGILATDAEAAKIIALRPGVVIRLSVKEGQFVRRGQALVTVRLEQQYATGLTATQEQLAAVQAQQRLTTGQVGATQDRARSERAGLAATITNDRQQRVELEGQVRIQQQIVDSLQRILDRYQPIAEKGFISKTEIDRREQELLNAQQGLAHIRQQITTLKGDEAKAVTALDRSRAEESAQAANLRTSAEGFRLQQSQLRAAQSYVITAPIDGIVAALQTGVGRTVDPSLSLMTIVPRDATMHAELYAPTRAIGFVKPGQEVRLLYDAFPYERFGSYAGRIRAVSRVALDPRQIDAPFKIEEPVYRVTVVPDHQTVIGYGENVRLQPGMTLAANVILERRSFVDWLLEPLNAIAKRDR
ncbi:HlyD family secretion protein [Sphingomonas sp. XXL09]|uniref:HlyD family secretion protein n=1 Tax=Sphingomonas sp. XXL09 TaxID=3457787 RepID=UPI00406BC535